MPTYDYRCTACGHTFEMFQKITAPPLEECPRCKGAVERLLGTGAAVIFKGSGFYATDYRSDDYKKKAKEESGAGIPDAKTPKKDTPSTEPSAHPATAKGSTADE